MLKITDDLKDIGDIELLNRMLKEYKDKYGNKPTDGYIYEFVDRIHCITNHIENDLIHHPAILYSEKAQIMLKKSLEMLYSAYQEVGSIDVGDWRIPKINNNSIKDYSGETVIVRENKTGKTKLAVLCIKDGKVKALNISSGLAIFEDGFEWCFVEDI